MKLAPTKIATLLLLAAFATGFGWSVNRVWPQLFGQSPSVPWLAAYILVLMAITLLGWTLHVRARIHPEPGKPRMPALLAARTVALAMASSRVGAVVGGFYCGFLLVSLSDLDAPAGKQRAIVCGVATLAAVAITVIAMWLERICQIPSPPTTVNGSEQKA
ncbi:MAG: DUF3180 family protein [Actinobacteria bacterium]|uniref:Unannotated protein n=1 Tax=freshwater metagenome TaxID=449393 RepID=A0A6J5ZU80_9ZZZZ|nr:DUF3180 family protein [Actinomycetota bacterium]